MPYFGTSLPVYGIVLLWLIILLITYPENIKISYLDPIIIILLILWLCFKTQQSSTNASFVLFRYYFGFIFFYIFFKTVNVKLNFNILLLIISSCIVIEALLVNTILPPSLLPNYPTSTRGESFSFETQIFGFYQRPYSIGGNASVTGTLVVILLFLFGFFKDKIWV